MLAIVSLIQSELDSCCREHRFEDLSTVDEGKWFKLPQRA